MQVCYFSVRGTRRAYEENSFKELLHPANFLTCWCFASAQLRQVPFFSPENLRFLSSVCLTLSWQRDLTDMLRKKLLGGQLRNENCAFLVFKCNNVMQLYNITDDILQFIQTSHHTSNTLKHFICLSVSIKWRVVCEIRPLRCILLYEHSK